MKFNCRKKSNLDEMQEQKLLQIEGNCFWILYWALFASVVIQVVFLGAGPKEAVPELICFLGISFYMVGGCARNGIWDRRFKPDRKTNLLFSIAAGVIVSLFQLISYWVKPDSWYSLEGLVFAMGFTGVFTFAATFLLMSVSAMATRKRRNALENESDEDEM